MSEGVIFMLTGRKHSAQLAVSVRSTLEHWSGPICLIAGCEASTEICKVITEESRRITTESWTSPTGKRGTQYKNKCFMQELSPFSRTIFLDADVLVLRPELEALLPEQKYSTTLTSWSSWQTHGSKMRGRCEKYRDLWPRHVARMVDGQSSFPAINTGVMAFTRDSLFMKKWLSFAEQRVQFIVDELACQIHYPDFPHTVKSCRWNCSPIFAGDTTDPVVIHNHGWKGIKRAKGRKIWLPHFESAYAENFGNIQHLVQYDGKLYNAEENRPCTDAELLERHGG